jgi:hypothetical protein
VKEDYYSILGAEENASQDEIERLYKHLARRHHPDRGGDEEEMKVINEAYRVLGNVATRSAYDAQRRPPREASGSTTVSSLSVSQPILENTVSGRFAIAIFYVISGLLFLFVLRFYYIRCLWPLLALAAFAVVVGVLKIHAAMAYAREGVASSHPMMNRYAWLQQTAFWLIVCLCIYGIYLMLRAI